MRRMKYALSLFGASICISCFGQQNMPTGLLCELLSHPELSAITSEYPSFSWILPTDLQGDYQTAWQILVASSSNLLDPGNADQWDTGKILSGHSIHVCYMGRPLLPHTSYWWKVRTWGKPGKPSIWSASQQFRTSGFDKQVKWPGESSWIQLQDKPGKQFWAMENRHPVIYHDVAPGRVVRRDHGVIFYDFNRSAFSYLTLNITCNSSEKDDQSLKIAIGEKAVGDSIDVNPGGGIIYDAYNLAIEEGTRDYDLKIDSFVPEYPNSQKLPEEMPEVIPFRYCEIAVPSSDIIINSISQKALFSLTDFGSSSFSSSNPKLDSIYALCKYSTIANTYNGDYANSQRERMMYEADCYIQQMCHYAVDICHRAVQHGKPDLACHMAN